jgi:hypothetical protein
MQLRSRPSAKSVPNGHDVATPTEEVETATADKRDIPPHQVDGHDVESQLGTARPSRARSPIDSSLRPADNQLLNDLEETLPDLVAAVRAGWASFDQLVDASEGKDANDNSKAQKAYVQIYPLVRATFEKAHGQIVSVYLSDQIQAYAAITRPIGRQRRLRGPRRWPDFHFTYDLATAPIAGHLFSRITQLGFDAKRIVPRTRLGECLDQLYSTTTDLMGIIEAHGHTDRNLEQAKIAIAQRDLDQVELRYMQVTARLLYFAGVFTGTAAAVLGALWIGVNAGLDSIGVSAVMFAAVGALLSVVQKMADDTLTVRYVVGQFYLWILGFVRPIIGAFAGLLLLLALTAGVIPLSVSGQAGKAYILLLGFAIGFAERSIPDVFSRAGVSTGLPPESNATSQMAPEAPIQPKTKTPSPAAKKADSTTKQPRPGGRARAKKP